MRRVVKPGHGHGSEVERPRNSCSTSTPPLVNSHSEKEKATPNFKRGFGFHPVLCYLEETDEPLAGILRPGNATANAIADNIKVLERALHQLPGSKRQRKVLVRGDSCPTHSLDLPFQNLNLAPEGQHLGLQLGLIAMAGGEQVQQDANHRIDQRSHHAGAKS